MNDFKLLAIRPLNGCHKRFSKGLRRGEVYAFYNEYKFVVERGHVEKIEFEKSLPQALYYQTSYSFMAINVAAIVGKNGS